MLDLRRVWKKMKMRGSELGLLIWDWLLTHFEHFSQNHSNLRLVVSPLRSLVGVSLLDFETLAAERLKRISERVEPISRTDERTKAIDDIKTNTTRMLATMGILTAFVIGAGLYAISAL